MPAAGAATSTITIAATASPPSAAKWVHLVPATNSTASAIGEVDEPGAEVGLRHHEHRRDQREQHDPAGRLAVAQAPHAVDDEAPTATRTSRSLPELGGWKLKKRTRSALRAARRRSRARSTSRIEPDHRAVEPELPLAQPRVVEARDQRASAPARRRRSRPGGRGSSSGRRGCRPGWPCRPRRARSRSGRAPPAAAAGRCGRTRTRALAEVADDGAEGVSAGHQSDGPPPCRRPGPP